MPIYEYECPMCKYEWEKFVTRFLAREDGHKCPNCHKAFGKCMFSPCGWKLEGDGWYNPHNPLKRSMTPTNKEGNKKKKLQ